MSNNSLIPEQNTIISFFLYCNRNSEENINSTVEFLSQHFAFKFYNSKEKIKNFALEYFNMKEEKDMIVNVFKNKSKNRNFASEEEIDSIIDFLLQNFSFNYYNSKEKIKEFVIKHFGLNFSN